MAGVWASPGRRSFLPGPLSPPLSYIPQPCNGPNGPKGLQSNKPKIIAVLAKISDIICEHRRVERLAFPNIQMIYFTYTGKKYAYGIQKRKQRKITSVSFIEHQPHFLPASPSAEITHNVLAGCLLSGSLCRCLSSQHELRFNLIRYVGRQPGFLTTLTR